MRGVARQLPRWMGGLFGAWLAVAQAAPATLAVHLSEPRAYGYQVGDVVQRRAVIDVPAGLSLDRDSLPSIGGRGRALELRRVDWHGVSNAAGGQIDLLLQYQVFLAPREVRTLEMPPITLRFNGQPRAQELRIDAWPVTVSPLVPVDVSPRRGLGELQPDVPPPLIDTRAGWRRLVVYGVLLLFPLGYLGWLYIGIPWRRDRQQPFARAWRQVSGLGAAASVAQRRSAYQQVHAALNEAAGEVVFESGLDRFVAARPRFLRLRNELQQFLAHSREEFFANAEAGADRRERDTWLVGLCRQLRDAERGTA